MIQAFVSLKPQYPARTESGMRSFFEALQNAVFSQPTIFRTNADVSVRPYSLDAITEAAMNPRCKFVVLRAECEKFWQCTFLLPDKQGMSALFFDLQRQESPRRLSPDSLIEMFKKLYKAMSPRVIRIGDSEAREKLKSRHGLIMMPGLGRIEWLQIVSPEIYGDIYNASELVAAPGYQTEIWEDGALFMRLRRSQRLGQRRQYFTGELHSWLPGRCCQSQGQCERARSYSRIRKALEPSRKDGRKSLRSPERRSEQRSRRRSAERSRSGSAGCRNLRKS